MSTDFGNGYRFVHAEATFRDYGDESTMALKGIAELCQQLVWMGTHPETGNGLGASVYTISTELEGDQRKFRAQFYYVGYEVGTGELLLLFRELITTELRARYVLVKVTSKQPETARVVGVFGSDHLENSASVAFAKILAGPYASPSTSAN